MWSLPICDRHHKTSTEARQFHYLMNNRILKKSALIYVWIGLKMILEPVLCAVRISNNNFPVLTIAMGGIMVNCLIKFHADCKIFCAVPILFCCVRWENKIILSKLDALYGNVWLINLESRDQWIKAAASGIFRILPKHGFKINHKKIK